ncbi:hypothetical protein ACFRKB_03550 [Streptomyces scopuliridis]|uniref:hypothetical protein n=1 Tax=Streptomyces scopuliridis TaxID=452529 RepID=UPI00367D80AA
MKTVFRHLLEAQGIKGYEAFLPFYRAAAKTLPGGPYDEPADKTFQGWVYEGRRPQNAFRPPIVAMFGRGIEDLWQQVPDGAQPQSMPRLPSGSLSECHIDSGMALGEMKRTGAMAVRRARKFLMDADRARVGENSLPLLESEVARLVTKYPRVPLGDIWEDLLDAHDRVLHLIETARFSPSQLRDANFLAGVLSFVVAKGCNDLEDRDQARTMTLVAAAFAKDAQHAGLMALVNGLQSLIEYWADRPTDAFFYAQRGAALAADLRGTVAPWLLGLKARAAASLGNDDAVRAANETAAAMRERIVPDELDQLGGLLTYSDTKQLYYTVEAETFLRHGDDGLARQAEQAVVGFSDRESPDWAFGDLAGAQCNLALVRLFTGDVDGAREAMNSVLSLPPAYRNNGIVVSAVRVREALGHGPVRTAVAARDLREEIAAFPPRRAALLPGGRS